MHDCIPLSVRLVVPLVPQIGPPLAGQPLRFGLTPPRDLLVVSAQQYRRHIHSAIARRPGIARRRQQPVVVRSEEHTSELQSLAYLVCRLLLEKKKKTKPPDIPTARTPQSDCKLHPACD